GSLLPTPSVRYRVMMTGFFAYYAVSTNFDALAGFRYHIIVLWMRALARRQQDCTKWDRINTQWLAKPRILHAWPNQHFAVKHPSWGPDARLPSIEHSYRNRRGGSFKRRVGDASRASRGAERFLA